MLLAGPRRGSEMAECSEGHLAGSWLLSALHLFQQHSQQICSEGPQPAPRTDCRKLNRTGEGTQNQGPMACTHLSDREGWPHQPATEMQAPLGNEQEPLSAKSKEKQGGRRGLKFSHRQLQWQRACQQSLPSEVTADAGAATAKTQDGREKPAGPKSVL